MRFLVVILIVLVGCRPPDTGQAEGGAETPGGVKVSLELPEEPAVGPAEVRVYLLGGDNEAVSGASVTVTGTMTHAGMEPVITEAVLAEEDLYVAEGFNFDMAGDWILQAEVTLPDGGEVTEERAVTVPGS